MEYGEEDFLLLSGIQHFCFCRRQWALIHIEQQWQENLKTVEGDIVHERCHDESFLEKRGDILIARGLRVCSKSLGVSGQCDVVEFKKAEEGCILFGHKGRWKPFPIEYKRGKSKLIDADRVQLCAQAMCLEEMLSASIEKGALYYNETHRREIVLLTDELRNNVKMLFSEMHNYYKRGYTPKTKPKSGCSSCSLNEICLPKLCKSNDVNKYFNKFLSGELE
ncbi:MAG: CRISPR-associated protein Cas4 [Phascolarctobacterium sp.]